MALVKLVRSVAFDQASWDEETGTADAILKVRGELPAHAAAFGVDRVYQGPQGDYEETFVVVGPDDEYLWGREYRIVRLRGEMFEDRFTDVVGPGHVLVSRPAPHYVVFLIDGYEAGRVAVPVDAPESAQALGVVPDALDRALTKSAVIWLTIPQPDGTEMTRPAWFVYQDGRVYVLTGPDEQQLPHISDAEDVRITARSVDVRAQVAEVPANVRVVDNRSQEFVTVAQVGLGTRLNLHDGDAALDRWIRTCSMVALTPSA